MAQESVFGRRLSPDPHGPADPPEARPLPSLQELGFTPADDRSELRAHRRGFRWRLLSRMGIWRWISAGSVCAAFLSDHLGLSWTLGAALGAGGLGALLWGVRRAARSGPASEAT